MSTPVRIHMVEGMAGEIWTHVGKAGDVPAAAFEAAEALADLFGAVNGGTDVVELAVRTGMRFGRRVAGGRIGAWMAEAALNPRFAQEAQGAECARCWLVDFMQVPRFKVTLEGDDLVWEGDDPMEGFPPSLVNPSEWPRSEVQTLLFDVDVFSEARARAWARDHGYRHSKVDTTAHYHRLRQFEPDGRPCRTVIFGDSGIKAVVCATDHHEVAPHHRGA